MQAQKALGVHGDDIAPTAKGQAASRKILGGLSGVAVGIAELRNALGTGHGKATSVPLSARHAHLAIGSASTFCRFLLETLRDRRTAANS